MVPTGAELERDGGLGESSGGPGALGSRRQERPSSWAVWERWDTGLEVSTQRGGARLAPGGAAPSDRTLTEWDLVPTL